MSARALEDLDAEDRAHALVCWASRWDDIYQQLTSGPGRMTDEIADSALVGAVTPLAHPLIGRDHIDGLIRDLLAAINQKALYDLGGFLPEGWEEKYGRLNDEQATTMLEEDINLALWPLLTAQTFSCSECRRLRPDVTTWNPVVYALRCSDHRLQLADDRMDRFGVGLVAS